MYSCGTPVAGKSCPVGLGPSNFGISHTWLQKLVGNFMQTQAKCSENNGVLAIPTSRNSPAHASAKGL
jgi:hypothetical protein